MNSFIGSKRLENELVSNTTLDTIDLNMENDSIHELHARHTQSCVRN